MVAETCRCQLDEGVVGGAALCDILGGRYRRVHLCNVKYTAKDVMHAEGDCVDEHHACVERLARCIIKSPHSAQQRPSFRGVHIILGRPREAATIGIVVLASKMPCNGPVTHASASKYRAWRTPKESASLSASSLKLFPRAASGLVKSGWAEPTASS
eukprot:1547976-Pleurochrysis_carterae.AAC.7